MRSNQQKSDENEKSSGGQLASNSGRGIAKAPETAFLIASQSNGDQNCEAQ
jgi:hypothetical protein